MGLVGQPAADIAISGIAGWVSIMDEHGRGTVKVRVMAPLGVEAFIRPPLPVPIPVILSKL